MPIGFYKRLALSPASQTTDELGLCHERTRWDLVRVGEGIVRLSEGSFRLRDTREDAVKNQFNTAGRGGRRRIASRQQRCELKHVTMFHVCKAQRRTEGVSIIVAQS